MPYIFCESCGAGSYSNVTSCSCCGRPARLARPRRIIPRAIELDRSSRGGEQVEVRVREMLYGHPSRVVRPREV
jgi:hypothetical protein